MNLSITERTRNTEQISAFHGDPKEEVQLFDDVAPNDAVSDSEKYNQHKIWQIDAYINLLHHLILLN